MAACGFRARNVSGPDDGTELLLDPFADLAGKHRRHHRQAELHHQRIGQYVDLAVEPHAHHRDADLEPIVRLPVGIDLSDLVLVLLTGLDQGRIEFLPRRLGAQIVRHPHLQCLHPSTP